MATTLKSLIMSFTKSIDLYNYLLKNHHRRTAIASYHIGKAYGLDAAEISDLVIAAALHDIGALTISERDQLIHMDIDNPHPHARLGSYMLDSFEPFHKISDILFYHHWDYRNDGQWIPEKGRVPIESYILHVADRIDILVNAKTPILSQKNEIRDIIESYKGTLFHPQIVEAFKKEAGKDTFWLDMDNLAMDTILDISIAKSLEIEMTMDLLEQFAYTISKIIDSRSKFTTAHSFGVSAVAYEIAGYMEYTEQKKREIRVAGLLHDIGKIAVSCAIIEKNGALSSEERTDIQTHVYFTDLILKNIDGLQEIANWAAHHHENHDGSGYPENLTEIGITEEMDILSYADIYTALSEDRPYRQGLEIKEIAEILETQFKEKHGNRVFQVVISNMPQIDAVCKAAIRDGINRFQIYEELAKKYEIE